MALERRLNPAIDPSDLAWEKVHATFNFKVRTSDKTLGDILLDNFTVQEVRQFFNQERPDLKALQKQNTERYKSLLAGRFKGVPSDVPTKLAMMYFGLPVEPVQTVLMDQDSDGLAVMEAQVARVKPLAFLANDELNQVAFATSEQHQDAMEIDESHQRQSSHVPVTSKSVLTVREQANLLQSFRSMRDIALQRSFPCPFDGCKYQFNPSRPDDAKIHIARMHVSKKCIWCDESHFEWWNEAQRQRHLRQKHRDKLLITLGVSDLKIISNDASETVSIQLVQSHGPVNEVVPDTQYNPKPEIRVVVPMANSLKQPRLLSQSSFSPLTPSPASSEDFRPEFAGSDSESERGRPRRRQKKVVAQNVEKAARGPERRAASPDWNVVLGEPDPSFVPDNKYYCSKCLRRVPKANRKRNVKHEQSTGEDYKYHMAGDRCCRIRSGIGSAENLPNRSGWILASKMPKLGVLKSEFLQVYPDYTATVYPLLSSDARNNMWRSDPNNESNQANWNLPWPPFVGCLPTMHEEMSKPRDADENARFSTGSSFETNASGSGTQRKGRRRKRRRNADGSYFYETDTDSESGLFVTDDEENDDGDDDDGDDANPNHRRKRRRQGDPNYRPRRGDESDSDNEPERLRKVREEMEQEILGIQDDGQKGAPTTKEGPDSFIVTDDVGNQEL
ncbi:hypothetical protein LLEC1_05810 [Akanthomyces lecanii]|uniref:Uncharacterized protein n=1 Tax=Cordyceps confragosa TaxID=2714763 RepID=A0A179IKI4_CORDF|nr:hypothetical protein LLEC1_05810 [Akanthomyces lecanii]